MPHHTPLRAAGSPVGSTRRALAVVLGVAALAHAPALWGGFVYDDFNDVVRNPSAQAAGFFQRLPEMARPLLKASYALQDALHGPSPLGFHAANLALHLAAAAASSDTAARLAAERFPERPPGASLAPDPAPFDPAALGLTLPEGAYYVWLSAAARETGELQFLSADAPKVLLAAFAAQAGQAARPLAAIRSAWPEAGAKLARYARASLFDGVLAVPFGPPDAPTLVALVYVDRLFGRTGFALIFPDGRNLRPQPARPSDAAPAALPPLDPRAFDAALLARAAVNPEAPAEETDLFLAIRAAGGVGAQDYLDLYPDGAYAAAARAMVDGPRLELGARRITETGPVTVRLVNLPAGTTGTLTVEAPGLEWPVATARVDAAAAGAVSIDIAGRATPGVYGLRAELEVPGAADPVVLWQDFSVELALATLRVDKTEFAPGEAIEVQFSGLSGSSQDYISTAAAGSPNSAYLAYAYAGGAREGRLTLAAPTTPGAYELRAFFNEDETVLRASLPITVAGAPVATPAPAAPAPPSGGPPTAHVRCWRWTSPPMPPAPRSPSPIPACSGTARTTCAPPKPGPRMAAT